MLHSQKSHVERSSSTVEYLPNPPDLCFHMDIIAPFIDSPEGMSLVADNKKYLSLIGRGHRQSIEAAKDVKDPYTRFLVTKSSDQKHILLQVDGKYCSIIERGGVHYLEAAKENPDVWCQFEVFAVSGKVVFRSRAVTGQYLSRISRNNAQSIEAAKGGIDDTCKFTPGFGDLIPPTFEILDVTWDSASQSVIYSPTVVTEDTIVNGGSNSIVQQFNLEWSHKSEETTTWNHAWGFEFGFKYQSSLVESTVARYEFMAKISYNGSYGTSSTEENVASFERKVTVTAAPRKRTKVSMVVKKADNVELPFTAKIRRTNADGSKRIIYEQGKWTGVSYQSAHLEVQEVDLPH